MQLCPHCGEENPDRFRLCGFCGAHLTVAHQALETRKTVTIVFCDLKGSTSLGERLDTESLREVLSHYFKEMKRVLERHGGAVEKYIGDAIMAVFGLPRVHEDDALRAVRAAAEMQEALADVNDELERRWGIRLINRTGVNTGEVISGDVTTGQRLVTGDAVNVAARLEQAAPELEVLMGETTYRLVKDAVVVKQLEPLSLKGKSEPVAAYQLVSVSSQETIPRRLDVPLVGRRAEMALLRESFERILAERTAHLVTVIGDAGVGKSRLIRELVTAAAVEAACLHGRCLPYGEGITFLPLADVVRQAAGIGQDDGSDQARAKLAELVEPEVFVRVAAAVGLSSDTFALEEMFWGARKLLETLGRKQPLLIVIEDIHWAEPTFLDLVEHLIESIQEAPVLLVCSARSDLLDERPAWGKASGASSIPLQPLSEGDSASIVTNLLGDAPIPQSLRARIVKAADGNPLFVEQIVSMLMDDGLIVRGPDGRLQSEGELQSFSIPPSISALLTARLDRLGPEERSAVERGSVMGPTFYRGAVAALSPEALKATIGPSLAELIRKQLVRADDSDLQGEDAFRFHHVLIRDAAYQGLLKRSRIELHELLAQWLEGAARSLMEYEELVGYHLEQGYLYRTELGTVDDEAAAVGRRAAQRLAAAGERAFARSDMPAAANLFTRAIALLPRDDPMRLMLLPDLGEALKDVGEFSRADELLTEAIQGAQRVGDRRLEVDASVVRLLVRYAAEAGARVDDLLREAHRAIRALGEPGGEGSLARAWRLVGILHGTAGRYGAAEEAVFHAIRYARLAGDRRQEIRNLPIYAACTLYGPTPIAEGIAHCEQLLDQASDDQRGRALVRLTLAQLHAMRGDFEHARELYRNSRAILDDLGEKVQAASTAIDSGRVEMLAEDAVAAEAELRRDYEALDAIGERYYLSTTAALLAHALYLQGRYDEAETFSGVSAGYDQDDVETQSLWRRARAKVLARRERFGEAEQLAREALAMIQETDSPTLRANTLMDLAEVHRLSGNLEEAIPLMRSALVLYEQKGNVVSAARTRSLLEELPALHAGVPIGAPPTVSPR